jgi:hypothetical protein
VIDTSNTNTSVGRGDITVTDTGIIGPNVGVMMTSLRPTLSFVISIGYDDIITPDIFCFATTVDHGDVTTVDTGFTMACVI